MVRPATFLGSGVTRPAKKNHWGVLCTSSGSRSQRLASGQLLDPATRWLFMDIAVACLVLSESLYAFKQLGSQPRHPRSISNPGCCGTLHLRRYLLLNMPLPVGLSPMRSMTVDTPDSLDIWLVALCRQSYGKCIQTMRCPLISLVITGAGTYQYFRRLCSELNDHLG